MNKETAKGVINWLVKYKIYHLPFWFGYHIMWWTLTIGSIAIVFENIFHSAYSIKFLFYVVFEALGAYFVLYFLLPRFLEKGKIVQFVVLFLLTAITTAALIVPGYFVSAWLSNKSLFELYNKQPHEYLYFFQINTLPSSMAALTLALSVKLTKNWIQTRKHQQILEKEKLETELKFLKSQFNPHFLFNSINSIFVLIHKNPDMASESLAKFSDLLRYQLYDCNEHLIPLNQELNYIENFIELEQLRQEKNLSLTVQIDAGNSGEFSIAPFILMPFIENAFKHVSKYKDRENYIRMNIRVNEQDLELKISNSISEQHRLPEELLNYHGIGLKNIRRRLELLYPHKHALDIQQHKEAYAVFLSLRLNKINTRVSEKSVGVLQH